MNAKIKQFTNVIQDMMKNKSLSFLGENVYFPDIPSKKLENARKSLLIPTEEEVLILFDDTAFGSAKDAMFFTTWGIRYKENGKWAVPWNILYQYGYSYERKKHFTLLTRNNIVENFSNINAIVLYIAKIDVDLLITLINAGKEILGNENKTNINSLKQLINIIEVDIDKKNKENKESDELLVHNKKLADGLPEYDESKEALQNKGLEIDSDGTDILETKQELIGRPESVDVKPYKISKQIVIVYDKNNYSVPMANFLLDMITEMASTKPEMKTKSEYEISLFEEELLGKESDKVIIFIGEATSGINDISWKYNKTCMKYGWNHNKAVLNVVKSRITEEEKEVREKLFKKYKSNNMFEILTKIFCKDGIKDFLSGK